MNMANTRTKRKKTQNLLEMYIHTLNSRTIIDISDEEQSDIASATKEAVITILNKCSEIDNKLEIQELIQVGSSTEDTKTRAQDEFDFMAILKHISPDKAIKIRKGCKDGYLQVFMKNPRKAWRDLCYQNLLQCKALRMEYTDIFEEITELMKEKYIKKKTGRLQMVQNFLSLHGTHIHWVSNSDKSVTNNVYADIMPTIKVSDIAHRNIVGQHIPKHLRKFAFPDDCCYLVLKPCEESGNCWLHSFAVAENKLVRTMDSHHKACYRSFKWIFIEQYIAQPYIFNSYLFKTATLTHILSKCDGNIDNCFISILEYVEECLDTVYMPSVFVPKLNIMTGVTNLKIRKQLGCRKIFDKEVERQAMSFLGRRRLELYYDACEASFIIEFWRRILRLLIQIYKNSKDLSAYDNNVKLIDEPFNELVRYVTDEHEQYMTDEDGDDEDTWFINYKPNWLDIKNLRCTYRRQVRNVEMPVFTDLEQKLKRHPLVSDTKRAIRKRKRTRDPSVKYKLYDEGDFKTQRKVGDQEFYFLSKCERFTLNRDDRIALSKIRKTDCEKFLGEKIEI